MSPVFHRGILLALACGEGQKPAIPRLGTAYTTILVLSMQTTPAMTAFIVSGPPVEWKGWKHWPRCRQRHLCERKCTCARLGSGQCLTVAAYLARGADA